MSDKTQVAKTILEQLGGKRFVVMTGAKTLTSHPEGALSFRLPGGGGFTKGGINYVKVQLNALDTYDVSFLKLRGANVKHIAEEKDVYADKLQEVFRLHTGLETRMVK